MKTPKYNKVTHAYADYDPVVYRAAFASQKTKYIFKENGEYVSSLFDSAAAAKNWKEEMEEFDIDTSRYVRESTVEYLTEAQAIKKFDTIDQEYRKLAGKNIKSYTGYLTKSGDKHKALLGIEDEYQKLRIDVEKPRHYAALRAYAETRDYIVICPDGYEADEMLVFLGESKGENGVILSIDKDMATAEETWFIHIQKDGSGIPVWNTALGHLTLQRKNKDTKGVGGGFKFLAYQALAGDRSDHYFGCKGVGPVAAVELIEGCTSKEEVVEKCLALYKEVYGDEYTFESWDGQSVTKSAKGMLQLHFDMPWMRDTPKGFPFMIERYL